jgi:transposase-like protein
MMGVKNQRRSFKKEFKPKAIRLADSSGKKTTQVAAALGISSEQIYTWRTQYKKTRSCIYQ